ncbi:methyltransferase, FxLD system [Kitasatospora sp. NPDC002227]|uniref:methyltransferase, FxLD system n=1 Tax=Kitasatospora sp. NPDC002227 TaxID=3154773 RepID=UPI00331886F1
MRTVPAERWEQHYAGGLSFSPLSEEERALIAEHAPVPEGGGRAVEVGCGTGELAAHLAAAGYLVTAVDLAEGALARAGAEYAEAGVRWLRLDVERDDPAPLGGDPFDLVVFRLSLAFVQDRTRVLHALGRRLRTGGTVLVITPLVEHTPAAKRHIALDEDEIAALTSGWASVRRFAVGELAVLVLRGPGAATVAAERALAVTGHAVAGALAVVTDEHGRVLLGWSGRGMWELPGGKLDGAEPLEAAAVRELAEETGLQATGAVVVAVLTDAAQGTPRITAVVRVTGFTGEVTTAEPEKFTRWEWHELHGLGSLGPVFAPAAQALDTVWPGVVPGLPPVSRYPHDTPPPAVPGESPEAVRRRAEMVRAVSDGGWAPSAEVRAALGAVPRHRFVPEAGLAEAYHHDLAVITRRDGHQRATSSVSAVWLQARMLENARLRPGARVLEVGSGGYNAALAAQLAGPTGGVVTVDLDPYVVRRTRRFTAEAGSGAVVAVQGDGALGAPAGLVPRGGFDAILVSYNAWDIAPAWIGQLAEGGHLVVPLEIHGYTRAIAFERRGDALHARDWTYCGFIRDRGALGRDAPEVVLADGELRVRFEDGAVLDVDAVVLEAALRGERFEVRSGVTVAREESFETLQLYLATTVPGFCRLALERRADTGFAAVVPAADAAAVLGSGSLAYLTHVPVGAPSQSVEFVAHAFGEEGAGLAARLAAAVRIWDGHVRGRGYPGLAVHGADTGRTGGHVVSKPASRLVFSWPTAP